MCLISFQNSTLYTLCQQAHCMLFHPLTPLPLLSFPNNHTLLSFLMVSFQLCLFECCLTAGWGVLPPWCCLIEFLRCCCRVSTVSYAQYSWCCQGLQYLGGYGSYTSTGVIPLPPLHCKTASYGTRRNTLLLDCNVQCAVLVPPWSGLNGASLISKSHYEIYCDSRFFICLLVHGFMSVSGIRRGVRMSRSTHLLIRSHLRSRFQRQAAAIKLG